MEITKEELQYLKKTISHKQLIDLVAIKSKLNNKRGLNEALNYDSDNTVIPQSFNTFINQLDTAAKSQFLSIFSQSYSPDIQLRLYKYFNHFLNKADNAIANGAG